MLPRFYAPSLDPAAGDVTLPREEASHLTRVLRLNVGADVAVFDGRGVEFSARVARAARDRVTLTLLERVTPAAEPAVHLALVQGVLKSDAMDDVVRDAVMMGVTRIDPIITSHMAVKESVVSSGRLMDRWRRVAIASAKQCRRATVPAVSEVVRFEDWLRTARDHLRLILVEPAAMQGGEVGIQALLGRPRPPSAALLVGPEGGWSPDERRQAETAGCLPVSIGALTLRADAVPIAAIALLRFALGDL
jgi:16S rRNA (uracil1498-N3)-methyltransferase